MVVSSLISVSNSPLLVILSYHCSQSKKGVVVPVRPFRGVRGVSASAPSPRAHQVHKVFLRHPNSTCVSVGILENVTSVLKGALGESEGSIIVRPDVAD